MPSFTKLFTLAACVAVAFAAHCPSSKLVHQSTIPTPDGKAVKVAHFACPAKKLTSRDAMLKRTIIDERGSICDNSCSNASGGLPPVSADCNMIKSAVQIQQANLPPSFTVDAFGAVSLTFQTCTMTFQSLTTDGVTFSYMDLVLDANQAGAGCFPPVQPFYSAGVCTGFDGFFTAT
ncbi:hypothetical protein BU17DRAFT_88430 [Hysterangium stoloniferum]|nr:hypothetical protein BU17DRAFT_88430 [Hysterangium stoloniferum]